MKFLFAVAMTFFIAGHTLAQINQPKEIKTTEKFGNYTVHYTVFNSKLIAPDVASVYKLNRAKDLVYLNVSVTKTENGVETLGLPSQIKIKATNLMQQAKQLDVIEIKEADATYYLAPFRINNEDVWRFDVSAQRDEDQKLMRVQFDRTLYTD